MNRPLKTKRTLNTEALSTLFRQVYTPNEKMSTRK